MTVRVEQPPRFPRLLAAWRQFREEWAGWATTAAITVGWFLLAWGIGEFVGRVRPTLTVAAGLYLLGLGGFRLAWNIAMSGVYTLTRTADESGGPPRRSPW